MPEAVGTAARSRVRAAATALLIAAALGALAAPGAASASPFPAVTNATQTNARWREGTQAAVISSSTDPVGTSFSFTLNVPGTATMKFLRQVPGVLKKGGFFGVECVAPPKPKKTKKGKRVAKGKPCTRGVQAGVLSFPAHEGVNTVAFQGVISPTQKLPVGSYSLIIGAKETGGLSALPAILSFAITG